METRLAVSFDDGIEVVEMGVKDSFLILSA